MLLENTKPLFLILVMINKFKKFIIYTINIPAYLISFFFPKYSNIWIFGAWQGSRYSDNSKYLFEYVSKNHKNIRCIWLTKSEVVINKLQKNGFEAYYSYSLQGYFYTAISGIVIVSSALHDVNKFVINRSIKINLWHAITLKKIGCDVDKEFSFKNRKPQFSLKYFKYFIYPFLKVDYDFVIASSEENAKKMITAFNLQRDNIIISGLPRTDILKNRNKNDHAIVAYLPTFRDNSHFNYFENFNTKSLNRYFQKKNIFFYYKTHFADESNWDLNEERIQEIPQDDIYAFLKSVDILITDYSSVFFDFCLSNRPIIFAPFDIKTYIAKDRELYYNYEDVTPGPKCKSWQEVITEIDSILNGNDSYRKDRETINKKFNKFNDFKNSNRLAKEILSLSENSN